MGDAAKAKDFLTALLEHLEPTGYGHFLARTALDALEPAPASPQPAAEAEVCVWSITRFQWESACGGGSVRSPGNVCRYCKKPVRVVPAPAGKGE